MHLGAPPIPHFGDHERGEDDDSEDGYGQELGTGREHLADAPDDQVNAAVAEHADVA